MDMFNHLLSKLKFSKVDLRLSCEFVLDEDKYIKFLKSKKVKPSNKIYSQYDIEKYMESNTEIHYNNENKTIEFIEKTYIIKEVREENVKDTVIHSTIHRDKHYSVLDHLFNECVRHQNEIRFNKNVDLSTLDTEINTIDIDTNTLKLTSDISIDVFQQYITYPYYIEEIVRTTIFKIDSLKVEHKNNVLYINGGAYTVENTISSRDEETNNIENTTHAEYSDTSIKLPNVFTCKINGVCFDKFLRQLGKINENSKK